MSVDAHFFDSLACCRQVFPRFSRCLGSQRMVCRHASWWRWSGWAFGPHVRGFVSCFARFHALKNCRNPCRARLPEGGLRPSLFRRSALKKRRAVAAERCRLRSPLGPAPSSWTDDCAGRVWLDGHGRGNARRGRNGTSLSRASRRSTSIVILLEIAAVGGIVSETASRRFSWKPKASRRHPGGRPFFKPTEPA